MDFVTKCSICFNRYTHKENVPQIISCGHTFCSICVSRLSRCPHCRSAIKSKATNLLVFQLSSSGKAVGCEHHQKPLFCPVCMTGVCLECVALHNMHGLLPEADSQVECLISEKLQEAIVKLSHTNASLKKDLERAGVLHEELMTQQKELAQRVSKSFQEIKDCLDSRLSELLEEISTLYDPLTSKLETLSSEFHSAISHNEKELLEVESIKACSRQEQIRQIRPFKLRCLRGNMIQKVRERAKQLPQIVLKTEKLKEKVFSLGNFDLPFYRKLLIF